jgi:carboxypeptidase PM20D1
MKNVIATLLEAAESLMGEGFVPQGDIWFALGGDEERSGALGAVNSARWFAQRNLHFSFVLDEGTTISQGQIAGVEKPLALFGIEEKGFASLDLTVSQTPGHSSRPPKIQAAAVLGRALDRLSRRPFPWHLSPTVEAFFKNLSPLVSKNRWALAHPRLLGSFFFRTLGNNPTMAAMLRTTLAMTMLQGSAADNVLPSEVRAVLNLRLLPPWTAAGAIEFVKAAINDDRVTVAPHGEVNDPVPANPEYPNMRGPGWPEMRAALADAEPEIPPLPFLMTATTDSRHYQTLSDGIFRFSPIILNDRELGGIHGHNERISIENLHRSVRFYTALFKRL